MVIFNDSILYQTYIYTQSSDENHFLGSLKAGGGSHGIDIQTAGNSLPGLIFAVPDNLAKSSRETIVYQFNHFPTGDVIDYHLHFGIFRQIESNRRRWIKGVGIIIPECEFLR